MNDAADPALAPSPPHPGAAAPGIFDRIASSRTYNVSIGLAPAALFAWFVGVEVLQLQRLLNGTNPIADASQFYPLVLAHLSKIGFMAMCVVLFLVRRFPSRKAEGLLPRMTAITGTLMMMLIVLFPAPPPTLGQSVAGVTLVALGSLLSLVVVAYLGRSFSIMAEARKLVQTGPYALVRHPLYVVEEIAVLGLVVQSFSPAAVLLFAAHLFLQIKRMGHEEKVLTAAFPDYAGYMKRVSRIIPGVY